MSSINRKSVEYFSEARKMSAQEKYVLRRKLQVYPILKVCEELGIGYRKNGSSSKSFYLEKHDSCIIWPEKNTFKRFSTGESGDVVAFLMAFGDEFTGNRYFTSVGYCMFWIKDRITQNYKKPLKVKERFPKKKLILPDRANNNLNVVSYLRDVRGISEYIIFKWINAGNLYEGIYRGISKKTGKKFEHHNCVFLAKNKGEVFQGMQRSIFSTGKWDLVGNDYSMPFYFGDLDKSKYLVITESVIDAMSIQTLYSNNIYYKKCCYISLNGVQKYTGLMNFLKQNHHIKDVTLCLDNDDAGRQASKEIKELIQKMDNREIVVDVHYPPTKKDWNEELKAGFNPQGRFEFLLYLGERNQSYDEFCREFGFDNAKKIEESFLYLTNSKNKKLDKER